MMTWWFSLFLVALVHAAPDMEECESMCPTCPPCLEQGYCGPVCSSFNVTFDNGCELRKFACLMACKRGKVPALDYPGKCQWPHPCSEEKWGEFPDRMRTWLEVLKTDEELGEYKAVKRPEFMTEEWLCTEWQRAQRALEWKFNDMDVNDNNLVEVQEWGGLMDNLANLEVCAHKYLSQCAGKDKAMRLPEWFLCMKHGDSPCGASESGSAEAEELPTLEDQVDENEDQPDENEDQADENEDQNEDQPDENEDQPDENEDQADENEDQADENKDQADENEDQPDEDEKQKSSERQKKKGRKGRRYFRKQRRERKRHRFE